MMAGGIGLEAAAAIDDLIAKSSIGEGLRDIEERGIDAHLADLEQEMAPKKRKSSSTYNSRTLAECRKRGWIAQGVEQTIKIPGGRTFKRDLFGVIDVIAIDPSAPVGQGTIGIQTTSGGTGGSHSPHRAKIIAEPRARQWIEAGNRLELWSWAKQGARGKAKRWTLRVEAFTVESWPATIAATAPQSVPCPLHGGVLTPDGCTPGLPADLLPDAIAVHLQRKPRC